MSFSSDLKNEIAATSHKNACCRKAFLQGILSSKAKCVGGEVEFHLENEAYCLYVKELISELYGKEAKIERPIYGGRCRRVSFSSKGAAKYMERIADGADLYSPKCQSCQSAFLGGVFFASGRISDPKKQYLLEFSPISYPKRITDMLSECDIALKATKRCGADVLYVKRSVMIEDFLALIGMNTAAFELMNVKIAGELRNNANRVANCDANNIGRAVSASVKQLAVLVELENNNLLSSLPEELERTARLRLANRDLSIAQLAAISVPPISKSGLSHRLKKIMEISPQLMPGMKK